MGRSDRGPRSAQSWLTPLQTYQDGPYGPLGIASSGWVDYVLAAYSVRVLVGGPHVFTVDGCRTLDEDT